MFSFWSKPSPRRPAPVRRPRLETLEDRLAPATLAFSVRSGTAALTDPLFLVDLDVNGRQQNGTDVGFDGVTGMSFDPTTRILYGIDDATDRLIVINPTTGVGSTGTIGFLGVDVTGVGLTVDNNGVMFMTDAAGMNLYTINKMTGLATLVGDTSALGVTALASAADGTLFGVTDEGAMSQLVTINRTTGAATPVGQLGLANGFTSGGIDFRGDGVLYGISSLGDTFTINLTTGAAGQVVSTMFAGFEGLAIIPPLPVVPPPPPLTLTLFAVGTNPNTQSFVRVVEPNLGTRFILTPFPGFTGSIRAAAGDVNGDLFTDAIVAVAEGTPHVKVIDGRTGQDLVSFFAFDPAFQGGANVSSADVNGDGFDEVIVGTASGSSHVKVFDVRNARLLLSFIAFPGYGGGVSLGGGDVNGDGFADVIVGTLRGASHVMVFSGADGTVLSSFMASAGPVIGIEVTAGDFDGNGATEIAVSLSGSGLVEIFDAQTLALLQAYTPYGGYNSRIGLDAIDLDGDGNDELLMVTLSGPAHVIVNDPLSGQLFGSFIAFPSARQPVLR